MKKITKMNTKIKVFLHSKGYTDNDFRFGTIEILKAQTLKEMRELGCEPEYPYVIKNPIVTESN